MMKRYIPVSSRKGGAEYYYARKRTRAARRAAIVDSGVRQVEEATVVGTIVDAGNAEVIITAAGMTGSPKTIPVAVDTDDDAIAVAGKIRAELNLDSDVTDFFAIGGMNTVVRLTAKAAAANDATMNLSIDNDTCTGLTAAPTSHNTTQGVAPAA